MCKGQEDTILANLLDEKQIWKTYFEKQLNSRQEREQTIRMDASQPTLEKYTLKHPK